MQNHAKLLKKRYLRKDFSTSLEMTERMLEMTERMLEMTERMVEMPERKF